MRTFLEIYFGLNIFYAGIYLGDSFSDDKYRWLKTIGLILGWAAVAVCLFIAGAAEQIWLFLDRKTYLPFWWHFYIVLDYRKLEKKRLDSLNKRLHELEPGRNKRRWTYMIAKLNEANNHIWVAPGIWVKEMKSWVEDDHEFAQFAAESVDEYCQKLSEQEGMTRPVGEEDTDVDSFKFMWADKASDLILAEVEEWRLLGMKYFPEGEIDILQHMNQYKEV